MQRIIHIPIPGLIDETIESIKEARISDKPIQFIVTKDIPILNDLISNPRVVSQQERYVAKPLEGRSAGVEYSIVQYSLGFKAAPTDGGWEVTSGMPAKPTLFVLRLFDTEKTGAAYQGMLSELEKFVQVYSGVVRSQRIDKKSHQAEEPNPGILRSSVLVLCPQVPELPPAVALYSKIIRVKTPNGENFRCLIRQLVKAYDGVDIRLPNLKYEEYQREMERQLRGLSQTKIEQIFAIIKSRLHKVYFDDFDSETQSGRKEVKEIIRQEKQSFIESSDVLKLVDCDNALQPAGLSKLAKWLDKNKHKITCYNEEHQQRAASMPKGILMSGVPGSGKSMTARYVANLLDLPLLKLDFGDLLDKWQGNSEHRMQAALDTAIEMAPCVLWVDEIEKAFSGINGGNDASSKRMISKFLTWMQDKEREEASCFVFATANSIIGMPPELFRTGRFDAKFYTFLPSYADCVEIFEQVLKDQNKAFAKHNPDQELFRVDKLVKAFENLLVSDLVLHNKIPSITDKTEKEVIKEAYTKETSDNKFFTGSDITSLIEVAKDLCYSKHPDSEKYKDEQGQTHTCIYDTDTFASALMEALEQTKTYGETNLRDCAETFSQICYTNFLSAAEPVLLTDSECYDEARCKQENRDMTDKKNRVYDMGAKAKFGNEYDKQMYYMIRNSINNNIREFKLHRERR